MPGEFESCWQLIKNIPRVGSETCMHCYRKVGLRFATCLVRLISNVSFLRLLIHLTLNPLIVSFSLAPGSNGPVNLAIAVSGQRVFKVGSTSPE